MTSRRRTLLVAALALTFCPRSCKHSCARNNGAVRQFQGCHAPMGVLWEDFIGIPSTRDVAGSGFDVLFSTMLRDRDF